MAEETAVVKVEEKALSIVDQAKAVKVIDSESYTAACVLWKSIGDMIKEVKETFTPICDAAHKTWKTAVAKRDSFLDPLMEAQKAVKKLTGDYDAEQERIRLAEQRRLEEIARAEEEARRKAELERLEAERKAEEERILQAAQAAELAGETDKAGELLESAVNFGEAVKQEAAAIQAEPVYVAPVVIPKSVPKMQGGPVYQERWDYEIIDVNLIPRQYMQPNTVAIGGVVRSLKGQTNIPGIKAFSKRV